MKLPDTILEWASNDDYAAGGATKVALAAGEAAEGAQPASANISAQEFNHLANAASRAARHVRGTAVLPAEKLSISTAAVSTDRGEILSGHQDGAWYCPRTTTTSPADTELCTPGFGAGVAVSGNAFRVMTVSLDWSLCFDIGGGNLRAIFYWVSQGNDWRDNTPPNASDFVTLVSTTADTACHARGCAHPDGDRAWVFTYTNDTSPRTNCTQLDWDGATGAGWSGTARTVPFSADTAGWVGEARYATDGSTIVVVSSNATVGGGLQVSVSTDNGATWSAQDDVAGISIAISANPLLCEYSPEHGGWLVVTRYGQCYLCPAASDPSVGANWVQQTTGADNALAIPVGASGTYFTSCARVGTMLILTVDNSVVGYRLVWTDDFFATYEHGASPWYHVAHCGRWVGYYGHDGSGYVVGFSRPIDEGVDIGYETT